MTNMLNILKIPFFNLENILIVLKESSFYELCV